MTCAVAEQGIPVLDTWNQTTGLYKFHRDNGHGYECSHYCFPSAPQARQAAAAPKASSVECACFAFSKPWSQSQSMLLRLKNHAWNYASMCMETCA